MFELIGQFITDVCYHWFEDAAYWVGKVVLNVFVPAIVVPPIDKHRSFAEKRKKKGARILAEKKKSKFTYARNKTLYFYYETVVWTGILFILLIVLAVIGFYVVTR